MSNTENVQEVEQRVILKPNQYESIKQSLLQKDAKFLGSEDLHDQYWCKESAKSFEDTKMDEVGTYSLRTRTSTVDGVAKSDLNTKVITTFGDHSAWDEHEVAYENPEQMTKILKTLGHKIFFELKKTRESYKLGGITFVLEQIENFGPVLEGEILTSADKAEAAKAEIRSFMTQELGIAEDQIVPKTVTYIMMQEQSKF